MKKQTSLMHVSLASMHDNAKAYDTTRYLGLLLHLLVTCYGHSINPVTNQIWPKKVTMLVTWLF